MRKMFKRMTALLLVVAMMLICFAGCGDGGEGGSAEAPVEADGRTVIYYAASYVTAQVQLSWRF